jgi:tRNA threonylcarbamoyladenosine biosynthesis protein TsaE
MIIENFSSGSPEETFKIAYDMAVKSKPGDIICLSGDLGVGKTVFTKGFAKGLGIEEPVVSPTFTIVQVYESGRMPLYHFDVYRIDDIDEMDEIGYEDCFFGQGVSLVEWADKIEELLPDNCTRVTISKDLQKGFDYRSIEIRKA